MPRFQRDRECLRSLPPPVVPLRLTERARRWIPGIWRSSGSRIHIRHINQDVDPSHAKGVIQLM